jgi:hypothetical protein
MRARDGYICPSERYACADELEAALRSEGGVPPNDEDALVTALARCIDHASFIDPVDEYAQMVARKKARDCIAAYRDLNEPAGGIGEGSAIPETPAQELARKWGEAADLARRAIEHAGEFAAGSGFWIPPSPAETIMLANAVLGREQPEKLPPTVTRVTRADALEPHA